jgi:hypothetical protein
MGNTTTAKATRNTSAQETAKQTAKPRKATFTVKLEKGKRVFTPVNRRAHIVARKLGKRTRITVTELKATQGKGSYVFYYYTDQGALRKVGF